MNKKILPLLALSLGVSVLGMHSRKTKRKKKKIIGPHHPQKRCSKGKMTIVIDGNDITVNGKPLDQLKERP
jgi:hypothetical protein